MAVLLAGCASNQPGEMTGLAAAQMAESVATAVPLTAPPTVKPPVQLTAVPTSQPTPIPTTAPPAFSNPINESMAETANAYGADFLHLTPENSGVWVYESGSFLHPIALEVWEETVFLLDGGRVLAINLTEPTAPRLLLAPGDTVEGARVIEPLDLIVAGTHLLALDRAGDVYRTDLPAAGAWQIARYDRPVRNTSGHYYVALAAATEAPGTQFLLETNYKYGLQFTVDARDLLWPLPDVRGVDIGARDGDVYVLAREMDDWGGQLLRYRDTRLMTGFEPPDVIVQPRQVMVGETAVFVLDQAGERLLTFSQDAGTLQTIYQLPRQNQVSAFWVDATGQRLIAAGRDTLFFYRQPGQLAAISGGPLLDGPQPHDPAFLIEPAEFVTPIGGSGVTRRDLQMPGAPRHYRLGIHQGVDFYWQPGTPVRAAADGVVVRAMLDYTPPTQAQFNAWRVQVGQLGYTSAEALDIYRGRQVWVRHDNGLATRYVHLSGIAPGIAEGVLVTQGQLLGAVGNSGSPLSLESETADAHLHFEIWLGDHHLGQFLRPIEAREWVERTFIRMKDED